MVASKEGPHGGALQSVPKGKPPGQHLPQESYATHGDPQLLARLMSPVSIRQVSRGALPSTCHPSCPSMGHCECGSESLMCYLESLILLDISSSGHTYLSVVDSLCQTAGH